MLNVASVMNAKVLLHLMLINKVLAWPLCYFCVGIEMLAGLLDNNGISGACGDPEISRAMSSNHVTFNLLPQAATMAPTKSALFTAQDLLETTASSL